VHPARSLTRVVVLGPLAIGFALIILASVMFQAIRQVGGSWSGAALAFGASLLIGWALGINWPFRAEIIQTVTTVALVLGVLTFLVHKHGIQGRFPLPGPQLADIRHDMRDLYEDQNVADRLGRGFKDLTRKTRGLSNESDPLHEHPKDAQDIMLQLDRMLPAQGWLTQRMARLREKAYHIRKGHITQIKEIQNHFAKLSPPERKKAARQLTARYKELEMDRRIERLDKTVAKNELRIRNLTQQAKGYLQTTTTEA